MRDFKIGWLLVVFVWAGAPAVWAQSSIVTKDSIETDAQLVSKVATGTPPLAVSSATLVPNLNADRVDGMEASAFALDADLLLVEADLEIVEELLLALGTAQAPRTGQTTCYDVAGAVASCGAGIGLAQDGDLQLGVTWPNPRFTDHGNGTVTDNLTQLIWLDDANCFGIQDWEDALAKANALFDGCSDCGGTNNDCGLTDDSMAGEWRLPNVREQQSLTSYGLFNLAVPNTTGAGQWSEGDPFSGVQPTLYWTSTTAAGSSFTNLAWWVDMLNGVVFNSIKTEAQRVWLVRGGQ